MGVSLSKGGNVSLSKEAPGLTAVVVGLGWDARSTTGTDFDLDASAIVCGADGKVLSDAHFVFFNNLKTPDGSVEHTGDNLTGEGEGDDEVITLDLERLPKDVEGLVFTVNSFRGQRFTELKTAYCRLLDDRGAELVRYDLGDTEPKTGVLLCKLVRESDGTWSMTALGEFHDGRNVKKMVDPARETLGWRR